MHVVHQPTTLREHAVPLACACLPDEGEEEEGEEEEEVAATTRKKKKKKARASAA